MADHYSLCLFGLMDRLWFHQIILYSESSTVPKTLKQQIPLLTGSLVELPIPSSFSLGTSTQEEISIPSPPITLELKKDNYLGDKEEKEEDKVVYEKERQTRSNLSTNRACSQSFSPSNKNRQPKSIRNSISFSKLKKSMSCRSLGELEMEEVKGFLDLGFIFKKENVSARMITVVPGLLRLGLCQNDKNYNTKIINNEEEDEVRDEKEEEKEIMRPYLSEAWIIKRPDSPLLNLRLPRVYAAADMKKHLKFWARTVASVIQQES
ncbi:hypothetical protein JCGZ_16486 [Jatropha curcas]|uniref:Uncharacterized protein n=1 Tax=Jatropha curcas TaxID=180498 RepID=A0A067JYX2_JATCU|nr:hypothetical protein JCGZ_16486 [Jatropha curcas]